MRRPYGMDHVDIFVHPIPNCFGINNQLAAIAQNSAESEDWTNNILSDIRVKNLSHSLKFNIIPQTSINIPIGLNIPNPNLFLRNSLSLPFTAFSSISGLQVVCISCCKDHGIIL